MNPYEPHLGVQSFLDANSALNLALAPLDLRHDPVDVLQFVFPLPEHFGVGADLVGSLAFHVLADVVQVVAAELLARLDELIELPLGPVGEALRGRIT